VLWGTRLDSALKAHAGKFRGSACHTFLPEALTHQHDLTIFPRFVVRFFSPRRRLWLSSKRDGALNTLAVRKFAIEASLPETSFEKFYPFAEFFSV